jgi:hypothetical protein
MDGYTHPFAGDEHIFIHIQGKIQGVMQGISKGFMIHGETPF